jgi:hypothetical protein
MHQICMGTAMQMESRLGSDASGELELVYSGPCIWPHSPTRIRTHVSMDCGAGKAKILLANVNSLCSKVRRVAQYDSKQSQAEQPIM